MTDPSMVYQPMSPAPETVRPFPEVVDVRWYNGALQMARRVVIYQGNYAVRSELRWHDVPSITEEVNDVGSSQCQGSTDPSSENK